MSPSLESRDSELLASLIGEVKKEFNRDKGMEKPTWTVHKSPTVCVSWWDRKPVVILPENNSSTAPIFPIALHYRRGILKAGGRAEDLMEDTPSHSIGPSQSARQGPYPRELRKSPEIPWAHSRCPGATPEVWHSGEQRSQEPTLQGSEGLCWMHWRSPQRLGAGNGMERSFPRNRKIREMQK